MLSVQAAALSPGKAILLQVEGMSRHCLRVVQLGGSPLNVVTLSFNLASHSVISFSCDDLIGAHHLTATSLS